jgi:hypothetical protein
VVFTVPGWPTLSRYASCGVGVKSRYRPYTAAVIKRRGTEICCFDGALRTATETRVGN